MLKVVGTESAQDDVDGRSLLDEIAREGARRMLVAALETEVTAYLEVHREERDTEGHALVVRMLTEWAETDPWFPVPFGETPLMVPEPIAIDPPHVARRVAVQHSHFTVHGTRRDGLERLANERDSRLVKITVQQAKAKNILRDLATAGITETTVFPDLEGLSRELHLELLYRPGARLSTAATRLTLRRRKRPTS